MQDFACYFSIMFKQLSVYNIRTKQTNKHEHIAYNMLSTYIIWASFSLFTVSYTHSLCVLRNSILILYSNTIFFDIVGIVVVVVHRLRGNILKIWNIQLYEIQYAVEKNIAYHKLSHSQHRCVQCTPTHSIYHLSANVISFLFFFFSGLFIRLLTVYVLLFGIIE